MASAYEWLNDLQGGKYFFGNPHSLHLQDKEFRLGQEKIWRRNKLNVQTLSKF